MYSAFHPFSAGGMARGAEVIAIPAMSAALGVRTKIEQQWASDTKS
jgi:hypothetical protein